MKYASLTFKYMNKHKLVLFIYTLIPGVLMSFAMNPSDLFMFFVNFWSENTYNRGFFKILGGVTQMASWWRVPVFLAACILVSVFIAALSGVIEREMRLGDWKPKNFTRYLNNNLLAAIKVLLFYYIALEVFGLLSASFIFLWCRLFSSRVAFAMSLVTVLALLVLLVTVFVYLSMWYPHMVTTGLGSKNALSQSIKGVRGRFFRLLIAAALVFIPLVALFWGMSAIESSTVILVLKFTAYPLVFSFVISYVISLMFVAYFDIFELDREDLNIMSLWKKLR